MTKFIVVCCAVIGAFPLGVILMGYLHNHQHLMMVGAMPGGLICSGVILVLGFGLGGKS